jgi:hypothetical protein
MAQKRKTLVNVGIEFLRELLKDKSDQEGEVVTKKKLEDLQLDDLRREKIRLEQEERKMLARLKTTEQEKRTLFNEGVKKASDREQRVLARRIKELDVEASNMDRMLQMISQQMRVLNGLVQIKERTRMATESGLNSILADIDLQELIVYIDQASVTGEFNWDKFNEVLNVLEEADSLSPDFREDQDVMDIVKAMADAREAADSPEAIEQRFDEMDQHMKAKQEVVEFEEDEDLL